MAHRPNASALDYSYEYYLDYLDLLPVDEKKLKANKHAVVIAFWVSLAALVALLFLFLLCMSCSGSAQTRNNVQDQRKRPWSPGLNCPLCLRRYLLCTGHVGDPAGSTQLGGGTRQQSTRP